MKGIVPWTERYIIKLPYLLGLSRIYQMSFAELTPKGMALLYYTRQLLNNNSKNRFRGIGFQNTFAPARATSARHTSIQDLTPKGWHYCITRDNF